MKIDKKLAIVILVIVALGISAFVFLRNPGDLPGEVLGPNPNSIPEDKLPVCDFTGAGFVEQPCYSPPGSMYL